MGPSVQRVWQLVDTIGPVFSHSGLKNWDLCLARDAVIARPRSLWITVKAALWAGLGAPGAAQGTLAHAASPAGARPLQDEGDGRWRRYTLPEIASIAMKRIAAGANEIRITRHGMEPDVYGLGDRQQTDRCRRVLGQLYPALYREESFQEPPNRIRD